MIHPASMTTEQRDQLRQQRVGETFERVELGGGSVYYLAEVRGKLVAAGYQGKSIKPSFWHSFRSAEHRQQFVERWADEVRAKQAQRERRRAERAQSTHSLLKGSVLVATWGYEQTNKDFFEVVEVVSDKTVVIRPIGSTLEVDGPVAMSGKVFPKFGSYTGEPMRKRATAAGVRISSYKFASVWDGQAERCTWYG